MKQIIRLTESDLSRIVKQVIFEQQTIGLYGIKGNKVKDIVNRFDSKKTIIKDKWGRPNIKDGKPSLFFGYDSKLKKWVEGPCNGVYMDNKTCQKILNKTIGYERSSIFSKVLQTINPQKSNEETYCRNNIRLASPDDNIDEKTIVQVGKKLGIIQFSVSSKSHLIDKLSNIKSERIKYGCNRPLDSIVIGTHGSPGNIMFTQGSNASIFNKQILSAIKPLVSNNTMVFFTACYGADFLTPLKEASEFLGTKVRGSSGIYTPIIGTSEKGFYECVPSPKLDFKKLHDEPEMLSPQQSSPHPNGTNVPKFLQHNVTVFRQGKSDKFINNYLLKNKMCKKVGSSGISWFN